MTAVERGRAAATAFQNSSRLRASIPPKRAKAAFDPHPPEAHAGLQRAPDDEELLHQVFRAMHTIKGTAGVFGFDPVVHFTHTAESVMDDVRSGGRELDAERCPSLAGRAEAYLEGAGAANA